MPLLKGSIVGFSWTKFKTIEDSLLWIITLSRSTKTLLVTLLNLLLEVAANDNRLIWLFINIYGTWIWYILFICQLPLPETDVKRIDILFCYRVARWNVYETVYKGVVMLNLIIHVYHNFRIYLFFYFRSQFSIIFYLEAIYVLVSYWWKYN